MEEFNSAIYKGPLRKWVAQRVGLREFAKAGCLQFGTFQCLHCDLAQYIPRTDCCPGEECPYCECMHHCPCGDAAYGRTLSSEKRQGPPL